MKATRESIKSNTETLNTVMAFLGDIRPGEAKEYLYHAIRTEAVDLDGWAMATYNCTGANLVTIVENMHAIAIEFFVGEILDLLEKDGAS